MSGPSRLLKPARARGRTSRVVYVSGYATYVAARVGELLMKPLGREALRRAVDDARPERRAAA